MILSKIRYYCCIFIFGCFISYGQTSNYYISKLISSEEEPKSLILYCFVLPEGEKDIQIGYFADEPYKDYKALQENKQILLATSATFSSSLELDEEFPIGFCSQNGKIYNKSVDLFMDGLILLKKTKNGKQKLQVVDLDNVSLQFPKDSIFRRCFNFRNDSKNTYYFLNYVANEKVSVFQSNLVYSYLRKYNDNFKNLKSGDNDRGRRFLVICKKEDIEHHIIVDVIKEDYLMQTAKTVYDTLNEDNFDISFIINLDTGSKDVIYAYNGKVLENFRPKPINEHAYIEKALSLLVYYKLDDK